MYVTELIHVADGMVEITIEDSVFIAPDGWSGLWNDLLVPPAPEYLGLRTADGIYTTRFRANYEVNSTTETYKTIKDEYRRQMNAIGIPFLSFAVPPDQEEIHIAGYHVSVTIKATLPMGEGLALHGKKVDVFPLR